MRLNVRSRASALRALRLVAVLTAAVGLASVPAIAQTPDAPPQATTTVVVSGGGTRTLFKIALPTLLGDAGTSTSVVETESRDFALSSLFQVLDPQSFTANLAAEGTGIDPASWRNVGAEGVVKGSRVAARQRASTSSCACTSCRAARTRS